MEAPDSMAPPVDAVQSSLKFAAEPRLSVGSTVALVRDVFWRKVGQSW